MISQDACHDITSCNINICGYKLVHQHKYTVSPLSFRLGSSVLPNAMVNAKSETEPCWLFHCYFTPHLRTLRRMWSYGGEETRRNPGISSRLSAGSCRVVPNWASEEVCGSHGFWIIASHWPEEPYGPRDTHCVIGYTAINIPWKTQILVSVRM